MLLLRDCSEESWSSTLAAPLAHSLTQSINQSITYAQTIRGRKQKCLYCYIDVLIAEFEGDNKQDETEF